jgi:hypothetical protein
VSPPLVTKEIKFDTVGSRFIYRLKEAAKKDKLLNAYALETIMREFCDFRWNGQKTFFFASSLKPWQK